ncbi:Zinc finger protein CONSTANS-like protein [Zostera marina]|uniref:Zinc finger protein CONSTANS-like protein n=1 Tax=Zostera marina TaxID=29655 RepID=A0A0K9Q145_ZOSMR|nr:Zinc finger protein CONSTANS-like protein [Zostera marina]
MSSSYFSGAGSHPYVLDMELVKTASPVSRSTQSSSTLSDSTTSSVPLAISTKKPRTQRKRPNQTCTEATALLAMIYPSIFSTKNLDKHCKLSAPKHPFFDTSELLPPFPTTLSHAESLHQTIQHIGREKPNSQAEALKSLNSNLRNSASSASSSSSSSWSLETEPSSIEWLDAESILDKEIGEGIDSIMGNLRCSEDTSTPTCTDLNHTTTDPFSGHHICRSFGFPMNLTTALRDNGNGDWWSSSPTVEMQNIVPNLKKNSTIPKKKKKNVKQLMTSQPTHNSNKKIPDKSASSSSTTSSSSSSTAKAVCLKPVLSLTLNYDGVIRDWSGHVFSEVADSVSPADIIAKLSDLDLLSEVAGSGGMRDASVLRYKEKRRTRLFSKKIRHQVKKVNTKLKPIAGGNGDKN